MGFAVFAPDGAMAMATRPGSDPTFVDHAFYLLLAMVAIPLGTMLLGSVGAFLAVPGTLTRSLCSAFAAGLLFGSVAFELGPLLTTHGRNDAAWNVGCTVGTLVSLATIMLLDYIGSRLDDSDDSEQSSPDNNDVLTENGAVDVANAKRGGPGEDPAAGTDTVAQRRRREQHASAAGPQHSHVQEEDGNAPAGPVWNGMGNGFGEDGVDSPPHLHHALWTHHRPLSHIHRPYRYSDSDIEGLMEPRWPSAIDLRLHRGHRRLSKYHLHRLLVPGTGRLASLSGPEDPEQAPLLGPGAAVQRAAAAGGAGSTPAAPSAAPERALPFPIGPVMLVFIDGLSDGLTIGIAGSLRFKSGIILAVSLSVEMVRGGRGGGRRERV